MAEAKKKKRTKSKEPAKKTGSGMKYVVYLVVLAVAGVMAITLVRNGEERQTSRNAPAQQPDNMMLRLEFKREAILSFFDPDGRIVATIDAEIAENNDERNRGLMYRERMEINQGMLFIFPYEVMQAFWMKNTILPLDMLFVNSKREIVTIHKNTTPYAETSYPSSAAAQFVVEVNAGFVDRHGIREGFRINWIRAD